MNALDIIVVTVIVMSGLFAFTRGFAKEALSIAAWAGATFAAIYGYAFLMPVARRVLPKGPVTEGIVAITLFFVALIALSLLTSMAARRVRRSQLSAVDRTLGLIFGLARGVLLVCLGYLALSWALPDDTQQQPRWMANARTLPLLAAGADRLRALVPAAYREKAAAVTGMRRPPTQIQEAAEAIRALSMPRAPAEETRERHPAYSPDDQHELNRLIQQQQDSR